MPNVMFTSVVGTTLKNGTCDLPATHGRKSTGIRSIRFIRKTHATSVSASGETILLGWPLNVPRTESSTNPMTISIAAWSLPGRPVVKLLATFLNRTQKMSPSTIDHDIVSTFTVQKLPLQTAGFSALFQAH